MSGGCACGTVRYEVREEPSFSFHCHCLPCQRATGGGHASSFIVSTDGTTVEGDLTYYERITEKGNIVGQGFCPACGSPVLNRNSGMNDRLFIYAGSLDDPAQFKPVREIFHDDAPPWDHVDPDLV